MGTKIGLALGGGGVRGLANIGAMKALLEAGIVPDFVAGTSMGAIVGSLYADTLDIGHVERTIRVLLDSEEFREKIQMLSGGSDLDRGFFDRVFDTAKKGYFFYRFMFRESVVSAGAFFSEMDRIIPDRSFSNLRIPFACMALDIVSGLPQIIRSGPLRIAVKASSAVPGILPPVPIDGRVCVDGGWVESVPISAVRVLGARFVIAVDVSRDVEPINYREEIRNSMDILMRAGDVSRLLMNTMRVREADFVIHPEVGDADWSEFEDVDTYITGGYRAAQAAIPALKRALKVHRIRSLFPWKRK
ncbi:MAG: NTE family protein RssA [Deltaproteobacteria bacterium ADurb.BinA179]|mgnify:FL=1|nr:MAG: NTE family protein RssA [Deltaproteobacteria bacterium ADurb.BinA179]